MERYLCVYMPDFRLQRLIVQRPGLAGHPLALYAPLRRREVLVACSRSAYEEGVRVGLTVTQARARCHVLQVLSVEPLEEQRALMEVAEALGFLSPRVSLEEPDAILVDITTTAHLFSGEGGAEKAVGAMLAKLGYHGRGVVADGPDTAWGLAAFECTPWREVPVGEGALALASLPLAALRASGKIIEQLDGVGIRRVGALARCPLQTLLRRFGKEGERLHRLANGRDERVIQAFRPESPLVEEVWVEEGCVSLDALTFVLKRILDRLEARMRGRSLAALRLELVLQLDPTGEHRVCIALSRPLRVSRPLLTIIRERLHGLRLEAPVGTVMLRVLETAPFRGMQRDLFRRGELGGETLDELLARLTAVFGLEAVFSPRLLNAYRPESAYVSQSFDPSRPIRRRSGRGRDDIPESLPLRPSVLLPVPEPIQWQGREGEAIRWEGRIRHVVHMGVPERLSAEWWHRSVERDYHVLLLDDGARWWAFRERRHGVWYLHGFFE